MLHVYNLLQLPSNISIDILHGENGHLVTRSCFIAANVTVMNFCANVNAKAINSTLKLMNSIVKPTISIANGPNSIGKVTNSPANRMKLVNCKGD